MSLRQNVAAVIVRDGCILLAAFDDETGYHYNFPGGGVAPGETMYDALRREVWEETGAHVTEVGRLLLAWEYAPWQHAEKFGSVHKLCMMFDCTIADTTDALTPAQPDPHQVGVVWLPLERVMHFREVRQ